METHYYERKSNISFNYYRLLSSEESNAVKEAAESYGKFLNMKVHLIESGTI
jgi:hypothetical protein